MSVNPESEELRNPATSAERLAQIAVARPDLAAEVAAHPNAYEGLLDWIAQYGDDTARAAVAARRAPAAPTAPPAPPAPAMPAAPAAPVAAEVSDAGQVPPMPAMPQASVPAQAPAAPQGFTAPHTPAAPATPGAPGGYGYAPAPGYVAAPPAPKKKGVKALVISVIAVVVAAALVVGGLFVYNHFFRGADSPQAAVEKLIDNALSGDAVGLFTSIAPSEIASLRPAFENLSSVDLGEGVDYQELAAKVGDALEITKERFVFEEEELAEGVQIVRLTSGRITIDGDPERLSELMGDVLAERIRDAYEGFDEAQIDSEIARSKEQLRQQLAEFMPMTFDVEEVLADLRPGSPSPFAVIVVDEGGWYVSPMMTIAEYVYVISSGYLYTDEASDSPRRGETIIAAKNFASPDDAMRGWTDGIASFWRTGSIEHIAETLPLPERRVLSIYGPTFMTDDAREWFRTGEGGTLTFGEVGISATIEGDRAEGDIDLIELTHVGRDSDRTSRVTFADICVSYDQEYQPYWSSQTQYESGTFCLDQTQALRALKLPEAKLIFTQENGGWLFNPTATIGEIATRAADALAQLAEEERLDELWEQ